MGRPGQADALETGGLRSARTKSVERIRVVAGKYGALGGVEPYSEGDPFSPNWRGIVLRLRHLGWTSGMIQDATGVESSKVRHLANDSWRQPVYRDGAAILWLLEQVEKEAK